jgi:hypothetical protein
LKTRQSVAEEWNLLFSNRDTGTNPTTSIYNASVVNFYNATGSLARFENKNIFSYFEKRSSLPITALAL